MKTLVKNFGALLVPTAGIAITLLVAGLYVYQPGWLRVLDHKVYDTVLGAKHSTQTSGAVLIVDIDEKSLQKYGQWPWPRYRMALLLEELKQAGVAAVGMDILFAEADRSSPAILRQELKSDLDVDLEFSGLPEALMDNDRIFARTLANGPFVLGFFFEFEKGGKKEGDLRLKDINPAVVRKNTEAGPDEYLIAAPAVLPPLQTLCEAVPGTGFINTIWDRDGVLRNTPMLIWHEGKVYANLGVIVLMTALGPPQQSNHLPAVCPNFVRCATNHCVLDVYRREERQPAAEPLTQQLQPHVLLLVHVYDIQSDFNKFVEYLDYVPAAVQHRQHARVMDRAEHPLVARLPELPPRIR